MSAIEDSDLRLCEFAVISKRIDIEEQPEKFIPVFNTEGGQSKIYRIENITRR